MTDLSQFPITKRWPASDPERIQLYSFPTPNGVKASIALEELGLPYEAHKVTLADTDVKSDAFTSLNPNGRIPALIDPKGADGKPVEVFESGAILIYLAEKTGKLLPTAPADRARVLSWLMFQMGGVGPMFGQLGYFFKFKGAEIEDPRPRERYIGETKRLLGVIDGAIAGKDWIAGDYSIADIAICPWLRGLGAGYGAHEVVEWDSFKNVNAYLDRFLERSAVQKGLNIPSRD